MDIIKSGTSMSYPFHTGYQRKVLKFILQENKVEYIPYIDFTLFDTIEFREIFNFIKKYASQYFSIPDYSTLMNQCGGIFEKGEKDLPDQKKKIVIELKKIKKLKINPKAIDGNITEFIKAQEQRKLLVLMGNDFYSGKYDPIKYRNEMDRIIHFGQFGKEGILVSKYRFRPERMLAKVRTHLPKLNEWLNGGLELGELGILMGMPNIGKTFFLVDLACAAALIGKNVFYYTLELREQNVYMRIAQRLANVTSDEFIAHSRYGKKMRKKLKVRRGEIYIKEYPIGGATISHIAGDINEMEGKHNLKPDLLLIDSADYMMPTNWHQDDHERVADIIVSIRNLAQEINIPAWTVSQVKQEDYYKDLKLTSGSRSARKVEIADVVIGGCPFMTTEYEAKELNHLVEDEDYIKIEGRDNWVMLKKEFYIKLLKLRRAKTSVGRFLCHLDFGRSEMVQVEKSLMIRKKDRRPRI